MKPELGQPCTILLFARNDSPQWDQRDLVNYIPRHILPSKVSTAYVGGVRLIPLSKFNISIILLFVHPGPGKRWCIQAGYEKYTVLMECLLNVDVRFGNRIQHHPVFVPESTCRRLGFTVEQVKTMLKTTSIKALFC